MPLWVSSYISLEIYQLETSVFGVFLFLLHSTWLALGSWSLQQLGTAVEEIQALEEKNIALSDGQEEMLSAWEEYRPL